MRTREAALPYATLQRAQRLAQLVALPLRPDPRVVVLRFNSVNVPNRNDDRPTRGRNGYGLLSRRRALGAKTTGKAGHRRSEPRFGCRLQQVIERLCFEGLQ